MRLKHDGLREAYQWINQARQEKRFRGPVYGPILLEVQVQDKQHAAYLESNCSCKSTNFARTVILPPLLAFDNL